MNKENITLSFQPEITLAENGDENENKPLKVSGIAYTGAVLQRFGGNLIIDIDSMSAPSKAPILYMHDMRRNVGFTNNISFGDDVNFSGVLLSNEDATKISRDSKDGFPWQLSLGITAGSVEMVNETSKVKVNGHDFTNGRILRNAIINEISFTPLGVDSETTAHVMSKGSNNMSQELIDSLNKDKLNLSKEVEGLTLQLSKLKKEKDELADKVANIAKDEKLKKIKVMFSAMGKTFTDDAAKPYLTLSSEQFNSIYSDLSSVAESHSLFSETATGFSKSKADELNHQVDDDLKFLGV